MNKIKNEAAKSANTTKLYDNFYLLIRLGFYTFLACLIILQITMAVSQLFGLIQSNQIYLKAAVGWKWIVLAGITLGAFWFTFEVLFSFSFENLLKLLVSYLVMILQAFILYQLTAFTEIVCKNKVQ